MIIMVDKDGVIAINQLCDAALKLDGIKALDGIIRILNNTKEIKESEHPRKDTSNMGEKKKEANEILQKETKNDNSCT